ncbi:MAG: hypothetical protein ACOX5L_07790 [Bacteroidales bacterium]
MSIQSFIFFVSHLMAFDTIQATENAPKVVNKPVDILLLNHWNIDFQALVLPDTSSVSALNLDLAQLSWSWVINISFSFNTKDSQLSHLASFLSCFSLTINSLTCLAASW